MKKPSRAFWIFAVCGIVVAGAITAGVMRFSGGEPAGGEAPEGADIKLAESGYSIGDVESRYWELSAGFVLENSGDQVGMAEVKYWYVDKKGETIKDSSRSLPFYVFPGKEVVGGDMSFGGTTKELPDLKHRIHDVKFEMNTVDVASPEDLTNARVTTKVEDYEEDAKSDDYESFDSFDVTLNSKFRKKVDVKSMGMLFRDGKGNIVGGWGPYEYRIPRFDDYISPFADQGKGVNSFKLPPGEKDMEIDAMVPQEAAAKDTEFSVSPFVTRDEDDPHWMCIECQKN